MTVLRASVTSAATGLVVGEDTPVLVDGADTPITAAGLTGYIPTAGDRLLVQKVGGKVEVLQFLSTGNVPNAPTFRQATAPDPAKTPNGSIWWDSNGLAYRLEANAWVPMTINAASMDTADVRRVVVEQGFTLSSGGTAVMAAGVSAPTVPPVVSVYWPSLPSAMGDGTQERSSYLSGLTDHATDSTKLVFGSKSTTGSLSSIKIINKNTYDLVSTLPDPSGWGTDFDLSQGGLTVIGGFYYVLGYDADRSNNIYIYKINATTGAKVSEVLRGGSGSFNGAGACLTTDGTNILNIWSSSLGDIKVRWYDANLNLLSADFILPSSNPHLAGGAIAAIGDAYVGDAGSGAGASTLWIGTAPTNIEAWTGLSLAGPSATRASTLDFHRADLTTVEGLHYDTTQGRFVHYDNTGLVHTYSKLAAASGASTIFATRYTYYDGDTGNYAGAPGSGTVFINGVDVSGTASTAHETAYSATVSVSINKRSWPRITLNPAPDVNNLDATQVDKANRHGCYVSLGGGTMWRQVYTAVGTRVVDNFDTMPSTGTPDVHDFVSSAQTSVGKTQSGALRLDGKPKTYLDGSGASNIDGLLPPGTIITSAAPLAPTGWLKCDGSAVSRATYPDLMAAIAISFTGTSANASINVTGIPTTITALLAAGMPISGPGVSGTTYTIATVAATSITLNAVSGAGFGTGTFTAWPFGLGDGTTTFNLPDTQGRFLIGALPAPTAVRFGKPGGNEQVFGTGGATTASRELRYDHTHNHGFGAATVATNTAATGASNRMTGAGTTDTTGVGGGNIAYHAMLVVNFFIKT